MDRGFIYLGFGVALGIIGFFRGFIVKDKKKLIENIPTSKVRSIAMGLGEVEGKAQPFDKLFESPFSKAQSIYYYYKIEEKRGKNSWATVAEYQTPHHFYLEDETGKVLINPKGAELHLDVDHSYSMGFFSSQTKEAFKRGLEQVGIDWQGFLGFERTLRCQELFILPGDHLYVMGTACNNPMVAMSDKGVENILISKEDNFFCISDKSQKELLSSLRFKTYLYLYGGPVLTVACLFALIMLYFR